MPSPEGLRGKRKEDYALSPAGLGSSHHLPLEGNICCVSRACCSARSCQILERIYDGYIQGCILTTSPAPDENISRPPVCTWEQEPPLFDWAESSS